MKVVKTFSYCVSLTIFCYFIFDIGIQYFMYSTITDVQFIEKYHPIAISFCFKLPIENNENDENENSKEKENNFQSKSVKEILQNSPIFPEYFSTFPKDSNVSEYFRKQK